MINTPDYETAASKALELLLQNNLPETPIDPLPILMKYPGVRVVPFAGLAADADMDRADLVPMFGHNTDACTFNLTMNIEGVSYVVYYNMMLTSVEINRALARELGHIALVHDGAARTVQARMAEAMCFAHSLLSPRPILHMLQQSGVPITIDVLTSTTGCSYKCVEGIQEIPPVHVPADLNRRVRDLYAPHINEFVRFYLNAPTPDHSPLVDLGQFMEGYEE